MSWPDLCEKLLTLLEAAGTTPLRSAVSLLFW